MIRKLFTLFIMSLIATILLPLIIYHKLTLFLFINTSFIICAFFLFVSLLLITVKSGFFDAFTYGFSRMFVSKGKELSKKEVDEIPPVSKLIQFDHSLFLFNGILMTVIMLIALFIYYN